MDIDPRLQGGGGGGRAPSLPHAAQPSLPSHAASRAQPSGPHYAPHLPPPPPPLQTSYPPTLAHSAGAPSPGSAYPPASSASGGSVSSPATPLAPSLNPLLPGDPKRPRACESCRALKVRCEPHDAANPTGPCRRCTKAHRECIFTQPSRKRQKKSDSKVAELEKKIDALTASLKATRRQSDADDDYDDEGDTPGSSTGTGTGPLRPEHAMSPAESTTVPAKRRRVEVPPVVSEASGDRYRFEEVRVLQSKYSSFHTPRVAMPRGTDDAESEYPDVVDQQLLSVEMAATFVQFYMEEMVPQFPCVVLDPREPLEDFRRNKPTLFLAVIAAASGGSHPDLHKALNKELTRAFAERTMVRGDKSMELVQALLITCVWYYPPDRYEELKFYALIHQATVMALDLGMGKATGRRVPLAVTYANASRGNSLAKSFNTLTTADKPAESSGPRPPGPGPAPPPNSKNPYPDPTSIEARRTFLACYWACSQVAVSMRRPNLLRFTNFMADSINVLETDPEAALSDKLLCQWVRLQRIVDDMSVAFAFDDPTADVDIADPRIQFTLKGFERQLADWHDKCPRNLLNKSLELNYHLIMLCTHEIALHVDHNVDDFRPPYTEHIVSKPSFQPNTPLSPFVVETLSHCMQSAHTMLDLFTSLTPDDLTAIPVLAFVRAAYACMILIKLYFTAAAPGSEVGKLVTPSQLRVEEYIDRALALISKAAQGDKSKPAGKFVMILIMLKTWYLRRKADLERAEKDEKEEERGGNGRGRPGDRLGPGADSVQKRTPSPATATPQTPLHLLSNAAARLSPSSAAMPTPPSLPAHTPKPLYGTGTSTSTSTYAPTTAAAASPAYTTSAPSSHPLQPQASETFSPSPYQWPPNAPTLGLGGIVEFQAGELGLGLNGDGTIGLNAGAGGNAAFVDESFWAMMDQSGFGMGAWMAGAGAGPGAEGGVGGAGGAGGGGWAYG